MCEGQIGEFVFKDEKWKLNLFAIWAVILFSNVLVIWQYVFNEMLYSSFVNGLHPSRGITDRVWCEQIRMGCSWTKIEKNVQLKTRLVLKLRGGRAWHILQQLSDLCYYWCRLGQIAVLLGHCNTHISIRKIPQKIITIHIKMQKYGRNDIKCKCGYSTRLQVEERSLSSKNIWGSYKWQEHYYLLCWHASWGWSFEWEILIYCAACFITGLILFWRFASLTCFWIPKLVELQLLT